MRNYSRQIPSTYYKFQSVPRNYTQEKRLQELHMLKQTQVKVGIYKYSTEDELGKGYSSKVYKGVQIQKIHKRYAIKVIQLKKFRGSNLEMLEAEIDIHKNLVHQNILRLHEVIKTPYFYYLILEYCPHGNLHEYIKQKKKLSQANAIEIMQQILAGFKYLIDQGVIHRDLKPANILRIGNKWKISDFGFSVKSKYGFKDRINVGTPLYMPPESLKKSYYSCKTDIFAMGVILYQMVEGKTPWESINQKQLLQRIKTEIIVHQHLRNTNIREFIFKACQLNQNKRMSKQEIMEYQIKPAVTLSQVKNEKISQRQSAIALTSNTNSRFNSRKQSFTADQPMPKLTQDYIKHNTDKLSNEFSLVRHIYSCLKNIDSFLIDSENRQIFTLTLFKLLLRIIRFLCDKKVNHYNLKNWLQYITSKVYNDLYQEMIEYSQLLEKQYLQHIKHNDIKVIRNVNRKFPDLCHSAPISEKFYITLREYLVTIIREHNHELMLLLTNVQKKSQKEISQLVNIPDSLVIAASQNQKVSRQLIPASLDSIDGQKLDKSSNGASAPRKIYESKRSLKRVSEIKIDDPLYLAKPQQQQQQLQINENSKANSSQVAQKVEMPVQTVQKQQHAIIATYYKEENKEQQTNIFSTTETSKKQQIVQKSQVKIKSQTSIAPQQQLAINDKIQALQSLYTIYRTSQLRSHQQDTEIGQKIKVIVSYNQSKLEKRDYIDLRRLLRNI